MNKLFTLATASALQGSKQDSLYEAAELEAVSEMIKEDEESAFSRVLGLDEEKESVFEDLFGL